jgi:hypothetical protein
MAGVSVSLPEDVLDRRTSVKQEGSGSAVSWPAVLAGSLVCSALALIFLALGAGMGLSSLSPWSNSGLPATKTGTIAIVWLIVVQIISAGMGGYIAGRFRTKWVNVHSHEVYFRDTAHGFLVWATALVLTAGFLTSAVNAMVGKSIQGESANSGSASKLLDAQGYYVDELLRSSQKDSRESELDLRAEVGRIFADAIRVGELPRSDQNYLTDLVVARAGVDRAEAERRVTQSLNDSRQFADETRKSVAHALYWLFLALLVGAFSATFAATVGGRHRDHLHVL